MSKGENERVNVFKKYFNLMLGTCHYTFDQSHEMYNTESEA